MRLLPRLPRETGRDYALRVIKDNIIRLELAPGCPVSENELAAELGLSRTPVREALMELARAGVVEIAPQKRSTVSPIDERMVEEARFTRDVLECAVVKLVCTMARDSDLEALRQNVELQEFYRTNDDLLKIMELDNQLHERFFRIAEKPQLHRLLQSITIHFDRLRTVALHGIRDLEIVADHRQIVDAICRRDPEAASAAMSAHLERCAVDSRKIREQYPQYFVSHE